MYVVQSLHGGPDASPNDKLCRLLFFAGALRDAGAVARDRGHPLPRLCQEGPTHAKPRSGHHALRRRADRGGRDRPRGGRRRPQPCRVRERLSLSDRPPRGAAVVRRPSRALAARPRRGRRVPGHRWRQARRAAPRIARRRPRQRRPACLPREAAERRRGQRRGCRGRPGRGPHSGHRRRSDQHGHDACPGRGRLPERRARSRSTPS